VGELWIGPIEKFQELCEPPQIDDIIMGADNTVASVQQLLETTALDTVVDLDLIANKTQDLPETANLYCAFCRWGDEEAGPRKRTYAFPRIDSLGRHVRKQHLSKRATAGGFHCPYQGCSAYLGCDTHFLNHTARQHGQCL
jgi:hypothetical protein